MLPPFLLAPGDAAGRAANTRQWLASLSLPAPTRAAATAVIEAVASGNRKAAAQTISRFADLASDGLDHLSITEIRELVNELTSELNNSTR